MPIVIYPTLAETFGPCAPAMDINAMAAERDNAIEDAVAAHELIDIQRAQIAEYQELVDAQRVHIREMEPLARRAGELSQALRDEARFCDYFRDEAIECASHLAVIDDLLTRVGIADAPTIDRVHAVVSLWLAAEARAQGLTIGNCSATDTR